MTTLEDAVKTLGKDFLTKDEIRLRFRRVLSQREFKALVKSDKVSYWPDSISKQTIYYRQGFLSEKKLAQYLQDNIQELDFDEMVLGFLKDSTGFDDLYDFLSHFDLKKNGEPWINELILVQTMDNSLQKGALDDILTSAEKAVIANSKIGPVTEEQMIAMGVSMLLKDESDEMLWRIRPVDWHLLVKTGDNPAIYQSAYCMKLANELQNLGISINDLMDSEKISDDKINTLMRLGLINNNRILNELGKQQVEFMSKCSFDFKDKHLLENLYVISEHWHSKALAEQETILKSEKDLAFITGLQSIKNLKKQAERIDDAIKSGRNYFEIRKNYSLIAKPFVESAMRAFSAKLDFYMAYEDLQRRLDPGYSNKEVMLDESLQNFTLKYWNLKKSDLIPFERFRRKIKTSVFDPFDSKIKKYEERIFKIIKKHKKVDDFVSNHMDLAAETKDSLPYKLFNMIHFNEVSERANLREKIIGHLEYVMAADPTKEEFYYFRSLLGKNLDYFKKESVTENWAYQRLISYARCNNMKITIDKQPASIDALSNVQFKHLIDELPYSSIYEWDTPAEKNQKFIIPLK